MERADQACTAARHTRCGAVEKLGEELTLTPHHTPSQSFDFIVWEKAYLDSIPAAAGSSSVHACTSISRTGKEDTPTSKGNFAKGCTLHCGPNMCTNTPLHNTSKASTTHILHPSEATTQTLHRYPSRDVHLHHKGTCAPFLQSASSGNDPTLMSCRTDADLPSFFFDNRPRTSDGGGFTNLEEAVQRYAKKHPRAVAPSPSCSRKESHSSYTTHGKVQQLNGGHEALLKRSFSQPEGGSSKCDAHAAHVGFNKCTSKTNSAGCTAVFDQWDAEPTQIRKAKVSCCPMSPGRRKHGQSTGIPSLDPHLQQEKHVSLACNTTLDIHLEPQKEVMSPMTTWADVMYMPAAGRRRVLCRPTPLQDSDYQSSFSDCISSPSSNYDHHAAAPLNMSKLRLWGLHHRFKMFCKKLCSAF